jgi:hypothetical protein
VLPSFLPMRVDEQQKKFEMAITSIESVPERIGL